MKPVLLATIAATFVTGAAIAAEPDYLDNRSDAASLVRSLYNAVNRQEYTRAWAYFGDPKPAKDFEAFVKGYEDTEGVQVVTGEPSAEGAAGSTYFSVPTAIQARGKDGSEKVFAGCYTARLANPQIQEPPFTGLHIEKSELKPSDKPLEEALPASCGDGPAPTPKDAALEEARNAFAATHATQCSSLAPGQPDDATKLEEHTIAFHAVGTADDAPDEKARLFRFFCTAGAYNEIHVYYLADQTNGVRELHFAIPELDIHYEGGNTEGKVEAINVIGFRSEGQLINSNYDDATKTITSHGKWRGVGDASSNGTWLFRNGDFSLVQYDVDASYDGEINPETVVDYNTAP